ncbi:3-oxoacyl-ACP reductase [Populibacterium corticicola]|uniref:3-oxoacyl-ACP reductase n=1 Tax=Populibacterium corticicola TaxID=1812826 RepID=A0ABW5XGI7_9MICO
MADKYTDFVSGGFGKTLAKKLGLPQPVRLKRFKPGQPLVASPVLVLGPSGCADTNAVAELLLDGLGSGEQIDVRRQAITSGGVRWGAIVVVLTSLSTPADLSESVRTLGSQLRSLAPSGRVLFVTRPADSSAIPAVAAARQGVLGTMRSLGKELRSGATANALEIADDTPVTSTSVLSALRFFLSPKSAFVDGQVVRVKRDAGTAPANWNQPLAGKVAVVTGAAQGIGAAIAKTLARDGAKVVAVDIPAAGDSLARVANEIKGTALQLDVTADDAGARIIEHAVGRHGGLDIVVHNAGITRDKLLANMDDARWDSVIAVNIESQLRMNEAFLASEHFKDAPRIVSLASTSGIAGNRGQTNYGASKAGVVAMVAATSPLLEAVDGTANAVAPGFIETKMTAKIPLATREVARRLNSLQQGGQPVDVAETIAFLASPASGGISGITIRVCGQNLVGA